MEKFQERINKWMIACFGIIITGDVKERNHRFFEEATELVQAKGMSREDAHMLVDYTYNRPVGDPFQEVGGVMVTLAALCTPSCINLVDAAETEHDRIWTKVEQIREKQKTKPKDSPLPQAVKFPQGHRADEYTGDTIVYGAREMEQALATNTAVRETALFLELREHISEYYRDLDARKHGHIAMNHAFNKIERSMGMSWHDHKTAVKAAQEHKE